MRQSLLITSIILAGLLGFMGYCWILLDLYQDVKLGRYEQNPLDTIVESGVIIAYCYVAFRFIQSKLNTIQAPHYSQSNQTSTRTMSKASGWFNKAFLTSNRPKLGHEADLVLRNRPHRLN